MGVFPCCLSLWRREKCGILYLSASEFTPCSKTHQIASWMFWERISAFSWRDLEVWRKAMSSANPTLLLGVPMTKKGASYSMYRIGDTGEHWGRPQETSNWGPVEPSRWILEARLEVKEATDLTRLSGHPWSRSRRTSRPGSTPSNAPFTSSGRREAVSLLFNAVSMSCTMQVVKSVAKQRGTASKCCEATILALIAIQERRRAIKRSRPFPRVERRGMGWYEPGMDWSDLLGLFFMTITAVLKQAGWWPAWRQPLKRLLTRI